MKVQQIFLLSLCLILSVALGHTVSSYFLRAPLQAVATVTPPAPPSSPPAQLIIPKLNLTTNIEYVGLDAKNRMDVPTDPTNVGWYKYGPIPGDTGNAVIDGHLDSTTGPAVFYKLNSLQIGDEIAVVNKNGQTTHFRVKSKAVYPFDQVPLAQVFGSTKERRLNLITCEGTFNRTQKNYSDRTVIYTEAI